MKDLYKEWDEYEAIAKHRSHKGCNIPDDYRERMEFCKKTLLRPLTELAKKHGYNLIHYGSGVRDIDLIAIPWETHCSHPTCLAEDIQKLAEELVGHAILHPMHRSYYFLAGCPGDMLHGRLGWAFQLGGGPYIDLSIMPPKTNPGDFVIAQSRLPEGALIPSQTKEDIDQPVRGFTWSPSPAREARSSAD